jgi:prepilin-type processing-associated H-X9-DG protein
MRSRRTTRAFSIIELLVIIAITTVLTLFLFAALSRKGRGARRDVCKNRLKNIGLAYRIFATDHNDLFPWQTNLQSSATQNTPADEILAYMLPLTNELSTPLILVCPKDTRTPATRWLDLRRQNISYFVGLDAAEVLPQTFLAGERHLTVKSKLLGPGRVTISAPPAQLSWAPILHKKYGNAVMADGSVQDLTPPRLHEQWQHTGLTSAPTFVFP